MDPTSITSDRQRPAPTRDGGEQDQQIRRFAIEAARLAQDEHCEDIMLLDVREHSQVTDYILIGSGTSDRQMRSVGKHMEDLAKTFGFQRYGRDEDDNTMWIVVDFVDVMVHLFEPVTRAHYDLEMMWGDAPQIAWQR